MFDIVFGGHAFNELSHTAVLRLG